ncbi:MAG: trypsin-like peptidase domain-containing protein [Phycisphaerales bacterium]
MRTALSLLAALTLGAQAPAAATHEPAPAADPVAETYARLAESRSGSVVAIKFVLKMEFGGFGDDENEQEVSGLMIDPSGLVLVSNMQLGGFLGMMQQYSGGSNLHASIKPEKIRVLVGEDTVGADAKLIARDTELDLAWVRIDQAPAKPYQAVDFARSAAARVGDMLYTVSHADKFFDRTPVVGELRVAGVAKKPRALLLPGAGGGGMMGGGGGGAGGAVYTAAGEPVGVLVMQMPSREDGDGGRDDMFGMMFSGGSGGVAILPGAEVAAATERALKTAADDGKEAEGDKPPQPVPAKPAEGGK